MQKESNFSNYNAGQHILRNVNESSEQIFIVLTFMITDYFLS